MREISTNNVPEENSKGLAHKVPDEGRVRLLVVAHHFYRLVSSYVLVLLCRFVEFFFSCFPSTQSSHHLVNLQQISSEKNHRKHRFEEALARRLYLGDSENEVSLLRRLQTLGTCQVTRETSEVDWNLICSILSNRNVLFGVPMRAVDTVYSDLLLFGFEYIFDGRGDRPKCFSQCATGICGHVMRTPSNISIWSQ